MELNIYNDKIIGTGHTKVEVCQVLSGILRTMEFVMQESIETAIHSEGYSEINFKKMTKGDKKIYDYFKESFLYFKECYPRTFNLNIWESDFKEEETSEICE